MRHVKTLGHSRKIVVEIKFDIAFYVVTVYKNDQLVKPDINGKFKWVDSGEILDAKLELWEKLKPKLIEIL